MVPCDESRFFTTCSYLYFTDFCTVFETMGVRGLEYFLTRADLVRKDPVAELNGIRLGIDGTFWLRRLLTLKDPFHIALGKVVPGQLLQQIQKDLNFYESHQIQPIFVFPSLPVLRTELPYSMADDSSNMRNQGWEQYFSGEVSAAQYSFESSKSFSLPELASYVIQFLIANNVIVVRAPFASIPQLVYFKQTNVVHAILASNEIICYNVDKWITGIHKNEFQWISRQQVLIKINLTSEQLLDTCLLCGIDSPTFPPIIPDRTQAHYNVFENAIHQIQMSGNGYTAITMAIQSSQQNLNNYLSIYIRYYVFWYFNPIYTKQGLQPINKVLGSINKVQNGVIHPLPKNVHLVFGPKLKQHFYHTLVFSLLNPHLLFQILSGIVLESPPLCNGSKEYKQCLSLLHINRGFVFDVLKQYMPNRQSSLYFWYDPKIPYTIKSQNTSYLHPMLNTATSLELLKSFSTTRIFKNQEISLLNILSGSQSGGIKTPIDLINNAQYRLLVILGYIQPDGISNIGQCLLTCKDNATAEGLFLAIELLRLEVLHGRDYSEVYPVKVSDDIRPFIQLITRVCSIIKMQHKDVIWHGPLNRNILHFNSILRLILKSIKQWNEVILVDFLQQPVTRKIALNKLTKYTPQMILNEDVNTSMGVLIGCYLTKINGFENICDVPVEIRRGIDFWDSVI